MRTFLIGTNLFFAGVNTGSVIFDGPTPWRIAAIASASLAVGILVALAPPRSL